MKSAILVLAIAPTFLFADSRNEALERVSDSATVLQEIMHAPDKGIPDKIMASAQCIGIIPGVKKAGFIVGAKYGKGVLVCRTSDGWSAPSTIIIEGGSVGLQIGAGETDVVLVVKNKSGEQKLMRDKFTLGASAGVMGGPVGRTAQAETDAEMHAEILAYSRSRGLFAGVDLGGATLRPDNSANTAVFGHPVSQRAVLSGEVPRPPEAKPLYTELDRYAGAGGEHAER